MKNKLVTVLAKVLIKIGETYGNNVSPKGYYKPKKSVINLNGKE